MPDYSTARFRNPHPKLTANTPEYFVSRMMAGGADGGPVAGQQGIVLLYNNATDGSVLHVWGVHCWVSTSTDWAWARVGTGTAGTLQPNAIAHLSPLAPQLAGQIYSGAVAGPPGTVFYAMGGGGVPFDWPGQHPFAILSPGQCLNLATVNFNEHIAGSFTWAVMSKNEGYY